MSIFSTKRVFSSFFLLCSKTFFLSTWRSFARLTDSYPQRQNGETNGCVAHHPYRHFRTKTVVVPVVLRGVYLLNSDFTAINLNHVPSISSCHRSHDDGSWTILRRGTRRMRRYVAQRRRRPSTSRILSSRSCGKAFLLNPLHVFN